MPATPAPIKSVVQRLPLAAPWVLALLSFIAVLRVLLSQQSVRESLYRNADTAAAPVIAETLGRGGAGAGVVLGDYAWYEPLWLMRATAWLPEHLLVWQALPLLLWGASVLLAVAIVRQVSASWVPVMIVVALLVCGGFTARASQWSPNAHAYAITHMLLLLRWLLAASDQPRWRRPHWVLLLGAVTAVGMTDHLLLIYGVAPLVVAALIVDRRHARVMVTPAALTVAVLGVVGGAVLSRLAVDALIVPSGRQFAIIGQSGIPGQLSLIPAAVGELIARSPFGGPISGTAGLELFGIVCALVLGWFVLRAGWRIGRAAVPEVFGGPSAPDDTRTGREADTVVVFAATAVAALLASWIFTTAPIDASNARYMLAGWVMVCVGAAALGAQLQREHAVAWLAVPIVLAGAVQIVKDPTLNAAALGPTQRETNAVMRIAERWDAKRGFGAYWLSAPLTLFSDFRLPVSPVFGCGEGNCKFIVHRADGWYAPQAGRTLLISDDVSPAQPALDPKYGTPLHTERVGRMTVRVYPRDIAPFIK